jgi:hypothetical protein
MRPDYFVMTDGRQYHSVRQLLARGWSMRLIAYELGEPDVIQETALGDRKLYLKHRVDVAERDSLEVCEGLTMYWQAKARDAQHRAKVLARRLSCIPRQRTRRNGNEVRAVGCNLDEFDYA